MHTYVHILFICWRLKIFHEHWFSSMSNYYTVISNWFSKLLGYGQSLPDQNSYNQIFSILGPVYHFSPIGIPFVNKSFFNLHIYKCWSQVYRMLKFLYYLYHGDFVMDSLIFLEYVQFHWNTLWRFWGVKFSILLFF